MTKLSKNVYAVILAGGSGTRFWPKSRHLNPKQLCQIGPYEESMIEVTLNRLDGLIPPERRMVVTHVAQMELTRKIVGDKAGMFISEPEAKNTANALALATLEIEKHHKGDDTAVMISLHADAVIHEVERFRDSIREAVAIAKEGSLALIGIKPKYPETGYGYIEMGKPLKNHKHSFEVESFREKPIQDVAIKYVETGNFLWNAGIFAWQTPVLLEELDQRISDNMKLFRSLLDEGKHTSFTDVAADKMNKAYSKLINISIDHAVLEVSDRVCVVSADIGWQDIGSWDALSETFNTDKDGNLIYGDALALDCTNTTIDTDSHFVGTIGLDNTVVVCAKGAILVCDKSRAQEVKKIVSHLKEKRNGEYT